MRHPTGPPKESTVVSEAQSTEALRERILGTWRMLAWKRRVVESGEASDAIGPDPIGYINYAPDSRVMVFVLRRGRPRPASDLPTEKEKVALREPAP